MPRRSQLYRVPRDWLATGEWPGGAFTTDAPEEVAYAVAIAANLKAALKDQNITGVARDTQLERSTLYDVLTGKSWPDTVTLAKLERHLEVRIWPDRPPKLRRVRD